MIKLIRSLTRIKQFIKFSLVGLSNTIINLFVYYVLIFCGAHYIVAYTFGFLISVCNAFYWNNKYVFKNKQEKSTLRAFVKTFASYGFSFFLSVVLMGIIVEKIGISYYFAPFCKMIITIPLNFLLNKLWAFKDRGNS